MPEESWKQDRKKTRPYLRQAFADGCHRGAADGEREADVAVVVELADDTLRLRVDASHLALGRDAAEDANSFGSSLVGLPAKLQDIRCIRAAKLLKVKAS